MLCRYLPITVPASIGSTGISQMRIMNKQLKEFSFAMINLAAPDMPDAFKDVGFCTVTSYFDGTYAAAPAGTALITMAAHTTSGGKKCLSSSNNKCSFH